MGKHITLNYKEQYELEEISLNALNKQVLDAEKELIKLEMAKKSRSERRKHNDRLRFLEENGNNVLEMRGLSSEITAYDMAKTCKNSRKFLPGASWVSFSLKPDLEEVLPSPRPLPC